jgi:hypothetical protein
MWNFMIIAFPRTLMSHHLTMESIKIKEYEVTLKIFGFTGFLMKKEKSEHLSVGKRACPGETFARLTCLW